MAAEREEVPLSDKVEKAISDMLAGTFRAGVVPDPDKSLKLSQSVLNLAHARQLLSNGKK